MKPNDICHVTNRSSAFVVYNIPEQHIRREFNVDETKRIPFQEILDVSAQPGGKELFHEYLFIEETEAVKEAFNIDEEPEYFLTKDQIPGWMNTCTLDEFKDALDFAPEGVHDLIKKFAVENKLNDVAKRMAIKSQLGFDVDKAIEMDEESKKEDVVEEKPAVRRATPKVTVKANGPVRRSTPNYQAEQKS